MAQGKRGDSDADSAAVESVCGGHLHAAPLPAAGQEQSEQAATQDAAQALLHQTLLLTFKALLLANKVTHVTFSGSLFFVTCKKNGRRCHRLVYIHA
jgi:hypothetical protein